MSFNPRIEGTASIRTAGAEFLSRFRQRVESGLLSGRPHPRSQYVVVHAGPDRLHLSAAGWWTAINVGLNEVELRTSEPSRVKYTVRYWRWAVYALGLGAVLAGMMAVTFLVMDLRRYIEEHPARMIPGVSTDQHVRIAWAMVLFWGFVWPWLLVALHKRPVRRLLERIIAEVDTAPAAGGGNIRL